MVDSFIVGTSIISSWHIAHLTNSKPIQQCNLVHCISHSMSEWWTGRLLPGVSAQRSLVYPVILTDGTVLYPGTFILTDGVSLDLVARSVPRKILVVGSLLQIAESLGVQYGKWLCCITSREGVLCSRSRLASVYHLTSSPVAVLRTRSSGPN